MKMIYLVGAVITLIVVVALSGPRVDMNISLNEIELPSNLDLYLSESESRFKDITEGTEKQIIWDGVPGEKTDISIVFIHGFSATRQELAPLADIIASSLQANLFYTRLAGHGRGGAGMIDGTVNGWANDANEALEIGRRLGNKVVLIGTSTGSTLITWLSLQPSNKDVQGMILLSPNFHPANSNMSILLWPWGEKIAEILTTVDEKIEAIDAQIKHTEQLKKGLMQKLLTGKISVTGTIKKHLVKACVLKTSFSAKSKQVKSAVSDQE